MEIDEIYNTLAARAWEGRTGGPLIFKDYEGLFGKPGRRYTQEARNALRNAGIHVDENEPLEFLSIREI